MKTCPICRSPTLEQYKPFCSKRCSDVDLHRWLKGAYVIPGQADSEEDGGIVGDDAAQSAPPASPGKGNSN